MNAPDSFVKHLKSAFDDRLRVRWSVRDQEWRIEQQVGNASLPPIRVEENRDDLICARDGYAYVLTVRTGDRMPCPTCQWTTLRVPVRDFVDIQCPYCKSRGKEGRVCAGFWPLDDTLIEHLQKIDPDRQSARSRTRELDERNAQWLEALNRQMSNITYAHGAEHYNEMVGIPQFAYSKATAWPTKSR